MCETNEQQGVDGDAFRRGAFSLDGAVVVVTGAASGLGLAMAEACGVSGASVVLADHDEAALERAGQGLVEQGLDVMPVLTDVSVPTEVERLFSDVATRHGRVDVAFANAGISAGPGMRVRDGGIDRLSPDDWNRALDVNLHGVFWSVRSAAAVMKPRRVGSIVITSSIAGLRTSPGVSYGYAISKAAVVQLTRQAALELAPWGVRVNSIAPGPFKTNISRRGPLSPEDEARWATTIPLGRMGSTEEVKGLAVLLASRASSFMTGAVIPLDGGAMTLSLGTTDVLYHPTPLLRSEGAG